MKTTMRLALVAFSTFFHINAMDVPAEAEAHELCPSRIVPKPSAVVTCMKSRGKIELRRSEEYVSSPHKEAEVRYDYEFFKRKGLLTEELEATLNTRLDACYTTEHTPLGELNYQYVTTQDKTLPCISSITRPPLTGDGHLDPWVASTLCLHAMQKFQKKGYPRVIFKPTQGSKPHEIFGMFLVQPISKMKQ